MFAMSRRALNERLHKVKERRRWSFVMQDLPTNAANFLYDLDKGYIARVSCVVGCISLLGMGSYRWLCYAQSEKPIAKRWFSPWIPITLIERTPIPGTKMEVFRFALPNPADYTGYDPISSVVIHSGQVKDFDGIARWFTPISHPNERGIVEFAIKNADPGRMSIRLMYLKPGDKVYMGRWMKEFQYRANQHKELGLICSTGGSSVALQLMNVMSANPADKTRLSVLYCNQSANPIPFLEKFKRLMLQHPDKFRMVFNVKTWGGLPPPTDIEAVLGLVNTQMITKSMPPPVLTTSSNSDSNSEGIARSVTVERPPILICAPTSLVTNIAGRPSPVGNYTYWQGLFYKFGGILKDLGYERSQVYKFGVSTHPLAFHH